MDFILKTVEMLLKQLESRLCVWKVKIGFPRKQHHAVSHKLGVALFGVVMNKSCFYKTLLSGVLRFITLKGEQMLRNLKIWMKRACVSFLGFFLSRFRNNEMKKKIDFEEHCESGNSAHHFSCHAVEETFPLNSLITWIIPPTPSTPVFKRKFIGFRVATRSYS